MNPYDIEQLLLSHIITFGNEAARVCLPQLTPEKFCFTTNGRFGIGHELMWSQIRRAYLKDNVSPILSVMESYFNTTEVAYLSKLPTVTQFDPVFVEQLTQLVDKQGLVYNVSRYGHALGNVIESTENFMRTLDGIEDIEQWVTDKLNKIRSNVSIQSEGYSHVSDITPRVKQKWEDIYSGKISPYIDSGIPILIQNHLFPSGEIAVIHGLSGGGKSTFVFQVQMGTAIDLYLNDTPGCVAINSLEMTAESLIERMAGILAHVNLERFKARQCSSVEYDKLLEWIDFVDKLPIFVDDTSFLTTTAMQYRASGLHVSEHGPVVQISSDYGELFRDEDTRLTKEQRIDKVFREQFHLSRSIGASVLAISQSTMNEAVSGKSGIAGVDGTRYSRGILQSADIVAEMWNPVQAEKAGRLIVLGNDSSLNKEHPFLLIQKRRSGAVGEAVPFGWNADHTTFFDLSLPHSPGKEVVYTHIDKAVAKMKGMVQNAW